MSKKLLWSLLIIMALLLAACGGGPAGGPASSSEDTESEAAPSESSTEAEDTDSSAEVTEAEVAETEAEGPQFAPELSVYNWSDYIDEELLTNYQAEYGVEIIYDTYASNEDLLAKLQAGATGYDVIFPSDYMVS